MRDQQKNVIEITFGLSSLAKAFRDEMGKSRDELNLLFTGPQDSRLSEQHEEIVVLRALLDRMANGPIEDREDANGS